MVGGEDVGTTTSAWFSLIPAMVGSGQGAKSVEIGTCSTTSDVVVAVNVDQLVESDKVTVENESVVVHEAQLPRSTRPRRRLEGVEDLADGEERPNEGELVVEFMAAVGMELMLVDVGCEAIEGDCDPGIVESFSLVSEDCVTDWVEDGLEV